ncbi:hypothetical protein AB0F91_06835 [Amycolatopsis sp. NPDC023774]|uniref:hypothetical protein n=1 Tax=Amycolatopsis sp. NPDC023774 TaxID=3155015 RepID=UPI0033F9546E
MGVGLVLVVPFCPQCHVAGGVLARGIERRGLPTTSLTTLHRAASAVRAPRATFLDFPLDFPLGWPCGRPGRPSSNAPSSAPLWRRAPPSTRPTSGRCAGCRSSERPDGGRAWEALVTDLYRVDNEIRGSVRANLNAHVTTLEGQEKEFTIRCAC